MNCGKFQFGPKIEINNYFEPEEKQCPKANKT